MEEVQQQSRYHPTKTASGQHRSLNWNTQQQQQKQLLQRYSSSPQLLNSSNSATNPPSLDHTSNSSATESWSTGSGRMMKSSSFGNKGHAVVVPPPTSYPSYYFPKEEEQAARAASPRSPPYRQHSPSQNQQHQQSRVARSPREAYYNQKRAASLERESSSQQQQLYSSQQQQPQQAEQPKPSYTSSTPVSPGRSRLQERARQLHNLTALTPSPGRASSSSLSYPDDEQDGFGAVTTTPTSTGVIRKSPSWQQYKSTHQIGRKEVYTTRTTTSTTPVKQAASPSYYQHAEDEANAPLSPPRERVVSDAPSPGRVRELREHFFSKQNTNSRQESPGQSGLAQSFDAPHSPAIAHRSSVTRPASASKLQERYQPHHQQQRQQYPPPPLEDLLYGGTAGRSFSPSRSSDITNSDTGRGSSSGGGTFNNKYYQAAMMARMRVPAAGPVPTEVVPSPRSSSHTRTSTTPFSGVASGGGVRSNPIIPPPSPRRVGATNTLDDSGDVSFGSAGVFSSAGPLGVDRDLPSVSSRHSRSGSEGAAGVSSYNPSTNRGRSRKPPPTASTNSRYYAAPGASPADKPATPLDTAYAAQRMSPRRPTSREPSPMMRERMLQFSGEDHAMSQQQPREPRRSLSHDSSSMMQRLQHQNSARETSIERLAKEFTGGMNTEKHQWNPPSMQAVQSDNGNVPSYTERAFQNRDIGNAGSDADDGNVGNSLPASQALPSPLSSPRGQSHSYKSSSPSNVASYWLQKEQGATETETMAREGPARNFQCVGTNKLPSKATSPPPVFASNGLSGKDQGSLPFWARDSPDKNSTPSEVSRAQSDVGQMPSWAVESPLRPTYGQSSFPRQARSDTVTSAENQDVANLVARLTAVSRDNPSMALAQIDSILKKESRSSSVSPEQQQQVEDARQEPVEVEDDLDSDDETSVSSITNPSYQIEKPFKDQIRVTTRHTGSSPELTQMSQKSLSSNRRPRPSALHHYQSATAAAGMEAAPRPIPQTKKTSRLKERLLQLEKCPPPSSINVKDNDREPSPFHDGIPDETRKMVPHIASDSPLVTPQPQRKLDKFIQNKDLLAKQIKTWDEMSRSQNNTPEPRPRGTNGNANTILPKLSTSPKASSRPHPWDGGEEPDSNSIVQEQQQTTDRKAPDGFFRGSTQTHRHGLMPTGRISRGGTNPFDEESMKQEPTETGGIRSSEQQRKKEQIASAFDDAWVAMPAADSPPPMKPENASPGESYPAARSRSQPPPARKSYNRRDPVPVDLDESFEGSSNGVPNVGNQLPSPGEGSVSNLSYEQGAIEVALLDESFEASSSFGMPPKSPGHSTKSSGKRRGFLKAFMRRAEKKKSIGTPGTSHASVSQSSAGIKSLPNQRRPEPQLRLMAPPPGFVPDKSLLDDPPRRGRGLGRERSRSQSTERFRSKSMAQKFGRVMRLYDHE